MIDIDLIQKARNYIYERIITTKRKFEVLYSSAKDNTKKEYYLKNLKKIEMDIKKLNENNFEEKDLKSYEITEEEIKEYLESLKKGNIYDYKILRNIPIIKVSTNCTNSEINSIWSYLNYFGEEYLGLLSEQNLKLDYGHAYQRDQFYTIYNECLRTVEEYGEICDQLTNISGNKEYKERLISLQNKQYRDIIIKTGKFLKALETFIQDIFHSEQLGEKVLLEPDKPVEITGSYSTINGVSAKQALYDLYNFVEEFIEFIKIPDIKKIQEE